MRLIEIKVGKYLLDDIEALRLFLSTFEIEIEMINEILETHSDLFTLIDNVIETGPMDNLFIFVTQKIQEINNDPEYESLLDEIQHDLLFIAIGNNQTEKIEYLIDNGLVDINSEYCYEIDENPIAYAINNREIDVVKLLIKKGGKIINLNILIEILSSIPNAQIDENNLTYMNLECIDSREFHEIIKMDEDLLLLLFSLANDKITMRKSEEPWEQLKESFDYLRKHASISKIKTLVKFGAIPLNDLIFNLIMNAEDTVILRELVVIFGFDLSEALFYDTWGWTAMHSACQNNVKMVEFMLDRGCDIEGSNCPDSDIFCRPIHTACMYGKLDIVKFLVERGASPRFEPEKSAEDFSPLEKAIEHKHKDVIKYLESILNFG